MSDSSDNSGSSKFLYFVAGCGVGAAIALLFAPKSGEETRDYIARKTDEGRDFVTSKGREIRRQAEDLVERAKDVVTKEKENLASALEAGKQAYQEEKARTR